jgi:hypothetical protein
MSGILGGIGNQPPVQGAGRDGGASQVKDHSLVPGIIGTSPAKQSKHRVPVSPH